MSLYLPRCLLAVFLACVFTSLSCDSQNEVRRTIPVNQQQGVDSRTIIAVQINNTFSVVDTGATDSRNITVVGDLTEQPYSGTLQVADWNQVFNGQSIEDFQSRLSEPAPVVDPESDSVSTTLGDTIVFLLPAGTNFKDGEIVTVHVNGDLTVRGSPIRSRESFTFRVSGGVEAEGELRVLSTEPSPGATFVDARPKMSATFNRAVRSAGLLSAITVRGSQSGMQLGGDIVEVRREGPSGVLEVRRTLAEDETLRPGESVHVTLSSAISEVGTGGAQSLRPHHLSFQVAPGSVGDNGWLAPQSLASGVSSSVAILAADFIRPADEATSPDGVEFVVVGKSSVSLFSRSGEQTWAETETQLTVESETDTFEVVAAVVYDVEPGDAPEVVLLLSGSAGSRIQALEVNASGALVTFGDPVDLPATPVHTMTVADLDANGRPEIVIPHVSRSFVPAPGAPAETTGLWTLLELRDVPPEIDPENPADLSNLMPRPRFVRVEGPLGVLNTVTAATRVEAADLNGDGRLDLIAEEAGDLFLHRNLGSATTQFAFRSVGSLAGRLSATLQPLAWVVADVDGDGDQDVLAWDDAGALLHRNRQISEESLAAGDEAALFFGLLEEDLPPDVLTGFPALSAPATVLALELDGKDVAVDGSVIDELDLVILHEDGSLAVLPAGSGELFFAGNSGEPIGLAVADINGDTGLDFVVTLATGETHLFLADDVTAPISAEPSSFEFITESGDLDEMIEVEVRGEFKDHWSGFTIALDYDESHLTYQGFEEPVGLERKGQFTLCPDANLTGCAGHASVRFTYNNGDPGSSGPDLLSLGTFLFQKQEVSQPVITAIEFDSFVGPGQETFDNTVNVVDGDAKIEEAVSTGERVTIDLQPTALVVTCSVLSQESGALVGEVAWSSPGGLVLSDFTVTVGGELETELSSSSHDTFETTKAGVIPVVVSALDSMQSEVMAECEVIGVHQPSGVVCEAGESETEVLVRWDEHSHSVDRFVIYRNGILLGPTVSGNGSEFLDTPPDTTVAINYEVAAKLRGVEGPRGSCTFEPGGTLGATARPTNVTARVLSRARPSDPNLLRFNWTNAEGYDRIDGITVKLVRAGGIEVFNEVLGGTEVEYTYSGENFNVGDHPAFGAQPGSYIFTVSGKTVRGASESLPATFAVPVPALPTFFSCAVDAEGDVQLEWEPVWPGYDSLELVTTICSDQSGILGVLVCEEELDRQALDLSGFITEKTESLAPVGVYEFRLEASHLESTLFRTCRVPFESSLSVDRVEAGIGGEVEIPVRANTLGSVTAFEFVIEYPSFVDISQTGIHVSHPGAQVTLSVAEGVETSTAFVSVTGIQTNPDVDGDGIADGNTLLATLIGSIPGDFSFAEENGGQYDLSFVEASLDFGGGEGDVPAEDGELVVRGRYVTLDRTAVEAGSSEEIRLLVRATFSAPSSVPDYHLDSYQLKVKWDPSLLELLPTTLEDLEETVVFDPERDRLSGQFFYNEDPTLANAQGEFLIGWIGLLPNPNRPAYVEPGVDLKLFVLKFRSKVGVGEEATFANVDFIRDTTKFTVPAAQELASVPDIEGWFGGGVQIVSGASPFAVRSILPAKGSLLGGNEVTIRGSGFGTRLDDLEIRLVSPEDELEGLDLIVSDSDISKVSESEIRFKVPDSGIGESPRQLAFGTSTRVNVEVTVGSRSRTLVSGYTYESPEVNEANVNSGRAAGGEVVILRGRGLARSSTVTFTVGGTSKQATVTGADEDGTSLRFLTPSLTGHENEDATVEVDVSDGAQRVARVRLEEKFRILPDGSAPATLSFTSFLPQAASICGGQQITVTGTGFLSSLSVRFGDYPAASVEVDTDGRRAVVTAPMVPEGAGVVTVRVQNGAGPIVASTDSFVFQHPEPEFLRGDVDENGRVDISDATLLSDILRANAIGYPENRDAADANDDGVIDTDDVAEILGHLFGGVQSLPAPYLAPGLDPTADELHTCG
jgi:hypothetical protein